MDYNNEMRRGGCKARFTPTFTAPSNTPACVGASPRMMSEPRSMRARSVPVDVQQAIDTLPLAMVYAPKQRFEGIKEPSCALSAGTIFDALDMPFTGKCGRCVR